MNTTNQSKHRRHFAYTMVIACASLSLLTTQRSAFAQVGGIQGTGNPGGAPVPTIPVQPPSERGVGRALQGVLQGQDAGTAIRNGLGEAAQSAVETPGQTQLRDRQNSTNAPYGNQPPRNQIGQPVTGNIPAGTVWQQDAQGRPYYRNGAGQVVYGNQNGPTTQVQSGDQYSAAKPIVGGDSVSAELAQLRHDLATLKAEVQTMKATLTELMKTTRNLKSEN